MRLVRWKNSTSAGTSSAGSSSWAANRSKSAAGRAMRLTLASVLVMSERYGGWFAVVLSISAFEWLGLGCSTDGGCFGVVGGGAVAGYERPVAPALHASQWIQSSVESGGSSRSAARATTRLSGYALLPRWKRRGEVNTTPP